MIKVCTERDDSALAWFNIQARPSCIKAEGVRVKQLQNWENKQTRKKSRITSYLLEWTWNVCTWVSLLRKIWILFIVNLWRNWMTSNRWVDKLQRRYRGHISVGSILNAVHIVHCCLLLLEMIFKLAAVVRYVAESRKRLWLDSLLSQRR